MHPEVFYLAFGRGFLIDVNPDFLYYIFFPAKVKNHYKELCLHEKKKKVLYAPEKKEQQFFDFN